MEDIPVPVQKQIELIGKIIGDAQSEMRALLLHLRPIKLDGKSLKKGIEQLLDELTSARTRTNSPCSGLALLIQILGFCLSVIRGS